jgi:DNA-binding transcriptional LysR family regulator
MAKTESKYLRAELSALNTSLHWDDYRIVQAISEAGSLAGGGRRAGLSHPTMLRRLNAIEASLGVRLFERFRTGYVPTQAGEEVLAAARAMSELTEETERKLAGQDLRPAGLVRLTTTDTLLAGLLARPIARFRKEHPEIILHVSVSNDVFDLSRREADIAIRPTATPELHLVGRRLGVIRLAAYMHKTLCRSDAEPLAADALAWIGPAPTMRYEELHAWMNRHVPETACGLRFDTLLGIHAAVRAGTGAAVLPAYLAGTDDSLHRAGEYIDQLDVDLWLLMHPDLRRTARIRATLDFFAHSDEIRHALSS